MFLLNDQVRAIIRAQFKGVYNHLSGGGSKAGRIVYWVSSLAWYGIVSFLAWVAATGLPEVKTRDMLSTIVSSGLLLAMLFWQFIPVVLASTGISLDLRRLTVYPIAPSRLFGIEVALRLSTGVEVMIVLAGASVGLARSPVAPWWGWLFFAPFMVFNLLLSAGVRDLLTRLMARRGVRELVVFGIVLLSASPKLLMDLVPVEKWKIAYSQYISKIPAFPWPWQVTAQLAVGEGSWRQLLALVGWVALAAWFGYTQFQRGLRWDADETRSKQRDKTPMKAVGALEWLYRLPTRMFRDPLGVLMEKEVRSLARSSRFRLVFFMGFSFGLIIWLPLIVGRNRPSGMFSDNILVWVSLYAALLLGEVLFWNCFGFDRMAVQAYYVMPVKMSTVLVAKNVTAVFFLLLEVSIITVVVLALRVKFPLHKIPEAFAVSLLVCVFLLAVGNLASTYYPRPMDPAQSWRKSGSGKVQGMLLLLYPVLGIPIALAYLARYAFESEWAFYAVLLSGYVVGVLTYWVSLTSSVHAAEQRREEMLTALSQSGGPMA